jgi:hypothetical protein
VQTREFTETLIEAITYNQLERYFVLPEGPLANVENHFDLRPEVDAIRQDMASAGGLKLSHAQRRMLTVLVSLWDGRTADSLFEEGLGSLASIVQSMDRTNRELLADIIVTFPGWGG